MIVNALQEKMLNAIVNNTFYYAWLFKQPCIFHMKRNKFLFMMLLLSFNFPSCETNNPQEIQWYSDELSFLFTNENVINLNDEAENYTYSSKKVLIYFSDGGCPLCTQDLLKIEKLNNSIFRDVGVDLITVLYGNLNSYAEHVITKKEIYAYPIFSFNYETYDKIFENENINTILVDTTGKVVFKGDIIKEFNDLKKLVNILEAYE